MSKIFPTTIVFIRHGESEANVLLHKNPQLFGLYDEVTKNLLATCGDDPSLSERGKLQAETTALHLNATLHQLTIDEHVQLFVSPLTRAQQTLQAFQQHAHRPLYIKVAHVINEMCEYDPKTHNDAETFVKQVFQVFQLLENKTRCAVAERQTLLLFGHSLFFNTMLFIISTHHSTLSKEQHLQLVLNRLCNKDRPKYLNCVYHLPNCSISSVKVQPFGSDNVLEWSILGVGKDHHLREKNIATGGHSDF